jgi:hypothetical protein
VRTREGGGGVGDGKRRGGSGLPAKLQVKHIAVVQVMLLHESCVRAMYLVFVL